MMDNMTTTDITQVPQKTVANALAYRDQLETLIGPAIDNVGRTAFAAAKTEATYGGEIDWEDAYRNWSRRLSNIIQQLEA